MTEASVGTGIALLVMSLALLASGAWVAITWTILAGLVVWSFGFNNVPLPVPGFRLPLVDAMIIYGVVASRNYWRPFVRTAVGLRVVVSLIGLSLFACLRLIVDIPRFGQLAGRDALYVLEAWSILLGVALVRRLGSMRVERSLTALWVVSLFWFTLLPFRATVVSTASPVFGIQRPEPLLAFTSAGFVGALIVLWFLGRRGFVAGLLTVWAAGVVLLSQSRAIYVLLPIALLAMTIVARGTTPRGARAARRPLILRFALLLTSAIFILGLLPPVQGRLSQVRPDFVLEQLGTLLGHEGVGSGSSRDRFTNLWPDTLKLVLAQPGGVFIGVGYGPDLAPDLVVTGDVRVRKPHNDFLELFARTGVVGLSLFVVLVVQLVRVVVAGARRGDVWARWGLGMQVICLGVAAVQPFFAFAYGAVVYFLLAGLLLGRTLPPQDRDPMKRSVHRRSHGLS